MSQPTHSKGNDAPGDRAVDMLKRVLAVAEIVAKISPPTEAAQDPAPAKPGEKTQK